MTTKRSAEGPCSLAYALYHARSLELCTFKKFYVGRKERAELFYRGADKPDLLPDVLCLMVRIFCLVLVLLCI